MYWGVRARRGAQYGEDSQQASFTIITMHTTASLSLLTIGLCAVAVIATEVNQCGSDKRYENPNEIVISNCQTGTCRLRRKHSVELEFKFTPKADVPSVLNRVTANVFGVPFPFIGVDRTSACNNVFDASGKQVGCPLKAGTEYVYKNKFDVLEGYPKLRVTVHWELQDNNAKALKCFEVPAKITS